MGNDKGLNDVPVRIHSSPAKCAILEGERRKYKQELDKSMQYIQEHGGAIIYFEPEAQSTRVAHRTTASTLQSSSSDGIDTNLKLVADAHYSAIPSLLNDMG